MGTEGASDKEATCKRRVSQVCERLRVETFLLQRREDKSGRKVEAHADEGERNISHAWISESRTLAASKYVRRPGRAMSDPPIRQLARRK
jgi:hypothetical protein